MRYVMAAACLAPATLAAEKKLTLRRQDVVPMVLSGVMGITAYYFCEYNGIQRTSTVSASPSSDQRTPRGTNRRS